MYIYLLGKESGGLGGVGKVFVGKEGKELDWKRHGGRRRAAGRRKIEGIGPDYKRARNELRDLFYMFPFSFRFAKVAVGLFSLALTL